MQTVDRKALDEAMEQLRETVGIVKHGQDETHTRLQGVFTTLDVSRGTYASGVEEFFREIKTVYVQNLVLCIANAVEELYEIACTGKSDALVQSADIISESFGGKQCQNAT